jgi:hypothetical protein
MDSLMISAINRAAVLAALFCGSAIGLLIIAVGAIIKVL